MKTVNRLLPFKFDIGLCTMFSGCLREEMSDDAIALMNKINRLNCIQNYIALYRQERLADSMPDLHPDAIMQLYRKFDEMSDSELHDYCRAKLASLFKPIGEMLSEIPSEN